MTIDCIEIKTELGCYSKADGTRESVTIVNEFSKSTSGALILASTRYMKVDGTLVALAAGETVSVGQCCGDCQNFELDGCAAGVAYKLLISINGSTVENKYVNLTDGSVTSIEPSGFVIGSCADIPGNTKMCFSNGADTYTQLVVAGVTTYLKNDAVLISAIDIAVAKAVVDNATYAEVVCCPECQTQTIATAQAAPTATGNTTNLNKVFKDTSGTTWFVDGKGNALSLGSPETVSFAANSSAFPSNPLAGDHFIVTTDGTSTGLINEVWLYSGSVWRQIPTSSTTHAVKQSFTAAAGQTVFTLTNAADAVVYGARNGSTLASTALTLSGTTLTYVPSANGGYSLAAGDRIDVFYTYEVKVL